MPIIDDNTRFTQDIVSGHANQIVIAEMTPRDKTLLQFVHYLEVTNDHVDAAEVVIELQITNNDLRILFKILQQRIEQIDKSS